MKWGLTCSFLSLVVFSVLVSVYQILSLTQRFDIPESLFDTAIDSKHENRSGRAARVDDSHVLLAPRTVPPFYKKYGLIVFLHVAKAGGTTLRSLFEQYDNVTVATRASFSKKLNTMKSVVTGKWGAQNKTSVVIEIHDKVNPTLWKMAPVLRELRSEADANDVPFFVFATIREPLSYAVSFYNFQNLRDGRGGRYEVGKPTERDFRRISLRNPQCLFFSRGDLATQKVGKELRQNFSDAECEQLYELLTETADWIGTMESMQTETLPLLTYMLSQDKEKGKRLRKLNALQRKKGIIVADKLRSRTLARIRNITAGDADMYRRAQEDYPIEMWTDF